MSRTAIIYYRVTDERNYHKDYVFFFQYPDGTTESIIYGDHIERWHIPSESYRQTCLQGVINKLENVGYNVPSDQVAPFMSKKIDKLIMQKSEKYADCPDNAEGYTNRGNDAMQKATMIVP